MSPYIDFRAIAGELTAAFPTSNLYFLLDHGGLPGLHRKLSKSSVKWASLFDGTAEASTVNVAPILIQSGSSSCLQMSRFMLDWLGRNGTFSSTVSILVSPLKIDALKERLTARLEVQLSENMAAMLRFFDPRVLESIHKFLTVEQANEFFSPAETWLYVDRAGQLVKINSVFASQETYSAPLVLSQQQEYALLDACEIDQVLDLLRSNLPNAMRKIPLSEQYAFVSRQVDAAKKHGFLSTLKFVLYTTVILLEGENFFENSLRPDFLNELSKSDPDFLDFFSSVEQTTT